ncbi:MAG TPA: thioredoxin domain-containing protein [Phycisphaerae bacterium]|nr:thioredoxin domain-containing protein [Phycisphaerae bacterium]HOJ73137.1 thioredoxin domain-containing protein [Phycisphaerae bacterium]HOM52210.1 thioredoxin domain-containing protein [Phycisphaerae bacterium]HON67250.1 thioredoxin domain-containing protein [Phycisphaerae bacterium]HOQ85219.1 thioredoxin domain-containing protein [Phycisphaerae bacterium]
MRSPLARGVVWGLAVLVCIVGIWLSMHLALLHYRTSTKDTGGLLGQVCTSFATSSCEKVAQSRYAWFPPLPPPQEKDAASAQTKPAGTGDAEQDIDVGSSTASTESHIPRVSTAQLGVIYFSCILCWLVFTGPFPATRTWPHVVFFLGTLAGVPASAFYEYVMWTQLEAWCPLCLATHVGTFLLPVFALLLWPRRVSAAYVPPVLAPSSAEGGGLFAPAPAAPPRPWIDDGRGWPTNYAIFAAVTSAILLVGTTHFFILNRSSIHKGLSDKYYKEMFEKKWKAYEMDWEHNFVAWRKQPVLDIPVEGRPVRGPANAPQTVVVFSDFECPSCARLEDYFKKSVLSRRLPNGQPVFKVIFKHWPICKDCNDRMEGVSIHPAACDAALAAEAARLVGGDEAFWKMHDLLFANQKVWKKSRDFLPYARQIGLDEAAFRKAMASSEALSRVREDVNDGANMGQDLADPAQRAAQKVDSTPTIFVNGRRLNSPQFGRTWTAIIQFSQMMQTQQTQQTKQPPPATRPAPAAPVAP